MTQSVSLLPLAAIQDLAAESTVKPFDCIVAGGGSTGLIFTTILARRGKRVALLEAGPCVLAGHVNNTELRYDGQLVRDLQRRLEYHSEQNNGMTFGGFVSCLGGRGLFWNGSAPRFQPYDFTRWPIDYASLIPYYEIAEREYRVNRILGDGPLSRRFVRDATLSDIPAVVCPFALDYKATLHGMVGGTIANGIAILLRSGALASHPDSHVKISSHSLVTTVLLNSAKDKARGVSVVSQEDGKSYEVLSKSVVLSGGAFESVKIARSSGIPDPHSLIGTRITEHMFCRANYPVPVSFYGAKPEIALLHVPANKGERFQLELQAPGPRIFRVQTESDWEPDSSDGYAAMVRSFGSVLPTSHNHLEVTDPSRLGGFRVHLDYSPTDIELRNRMQVAMERFRSVLGLQPANIEIRPTGSSYHEAGGLWMGKDQATSLTDAAGRFHRVRNLVSGDAANFPDLPAANPHLTLAALAFFKSEVLASDLMS